MLKQVSRAVSRTAGMHAPDHLSLVKTSLASSGSSLAIFRAYGACLHSVSLQRVTCLDTLAVPAVLALCPALTRLSVVDIVDWSWADDAVGASITSQRALLELRLQCADALSAERNPFAAIVKRLPALALLRKLTLFSRLDAQSMAALVSWLSDARASRRLVKLKVSTGLLAGDGASALFAAVAAHGTLSKVTIVRPDGIGEPLRKAHCAALSVAIVKNTHLVSLHLRRVGLWTDGLSALVPASTVKTLRRLKLDGNSLGYLSGAYFCEAFDALLSRLPMLQSLHLGNNQLDSSQIEGLAASFARYKMAALDNLTVGSNDAGDRGVAQLLKSLPTSIKQLYLHGVDVSDAGIVHICAALPNFTSLWGLGLNGNVSASCCQQEASVAKKRPHPFTANRIRCAPHFAARLGHRCRSACASADWQLIAQGRRHHAVGHHRRGRAAARARTRDDQGPALRLPLLLRLQGRDQGALRVSTLFFSCFHWHVGRARDSRIALLLSHPAQVSEAGKAELKKHLPPFACAALNHSMSRYLKAP